MRPVLLIAALFGLASAGAPAAASGKDTTSLFYACAPCRAFVAEVVALGHRVESEHGNEGHPGTFPEVAAQLSNAREERLCASLPDHAGHATACRDVAQVYGLENAASIAHAAPDLLCEQLASCGAKTTSPSSTTSSRSGMRMTKEQATEVLGDVLVSSSPSSSSSGVSKGVMSMMSSLFKMRMQSQMMMQAMQMRQQLMENEHKMMQKVMRAMARNRAIRAELKHLKKMAYREQPGNCDCCDGCLPPDAKGGKKH